jgi:hypothetical protein
MKLIRTPPNHIPTQQPNAKIIIIIFRNNWRKNNQLREFEFYQSQIFKTNLNGASHYKLDLKMNPTIFIVNF